MQLRDALDDYKRHSGHRTRFPGERRSTAGLFSGRDGRLVHVSPEGSVRDFGYPLTGQNGIERSRLGIRQEDEVVWFDDCETLSQTYHEDTALVVTEHVLDFGVATQYDLTLGDAHLTHVVVESESGDDSKLEDDSKLGGDSKLRDDSKSEEKNDRSDRDDPQDVEVVVFVGFAPEGQDARVGQLYHEDALEVYHDDEHDFVTSSTGFAEFEGQTPAKFAEILDEDPVDLPRPLSDGQYESRLSGNLVCVLPVENGSTTLATLLTDWTETTREHALGRLGELSTAYTDVDSLERAAEAQVGVPLSADVPYAETLAGDLRVLSLLSAETGLRIAGPDFDPFYAYSGGYGYTWFRDDAEISQFCFEAAEQFGLDLGEWHARSARAYCRTQRDDGSWPHRVWPRNGTLAPGWANGRLETGDDLDYQADQTGSVIAFLGSYVTATDVPDTLADDVSRTLRRALDGLDETLEDDGRPVACQNAWEDMTGRFGHTTATFLEAYATLAQTNLDGSDHAVEQATRVYDAVDDLWVDEKGIYALREYSEDAPPVAETPDDGASATDDNASDTDDVDSTATVDADSSITGNAESTTPVDAASSTTGDADHPRYEAGDLDDRCDSATLGLVAAHRAYDRVDDVDDDRLDRLVSHVDTVVETLRRTPSAGVDGLVRYEGDDWRVCEQTDEKIWSVSTAWGAHAAAGLAALLADHDDDRAAEFADLARDLLSLIMPGTALSIEGDYLPEQVFDDGTPDSATPLGWPHALRLATVAFMDEYDMLCDSSAVVDD